MRKVITDEYITYGGDFDRILYLQTKVNKRMGLNLCLAGDDYDVCYHLTSTEPLYIDWLWNHAEDLLTISKDNWYKSELGRPEHDLYNTFHYTLKQLHKLINLC